MSILKSKVLFKDKYYVPDEEHHFLSLIYHITYHKAEESGLQIDQDRKVLYKEKDHDYPQFLRSFSQISSIDGVINLYNLHRYLSSRNLSPKLDALRKLYMINKSNFLFEIASSYI
ncbi:MAG: hypothetical protein PHG06_24045, partial [Parabacteroides sp.]|nr:hypothetical protein [Parabacteroides sp.]